MFSDLSRCFQLTHDTPTIRAIQALRLNVDLDLVDAAGTRTCRVPFRVDTGADVSVIPPQFMGQLGWQLSSAQDGLQIETASGNRLPCRLAFGRTFRFRPLAGFWFRTDFAVSNGLHTQFGLLAWRDLALDFWSRTTHMPRLGPGSSSLLVPGIQQFCLRTDRFPARIGQPPSVP